MARKPAKKNTSSVKVDFSGVEARTVLPEGEYITAVIGVKLEESESSGNQYLAWELAVADGKHNGKKLFNNTSLAEQSLWATKTFLQNLGVEVDDGEMELELDDYVDMQIGVVVEHEVYKGKTRSVVKDTYPAEEDGGEKGDGDSKGQGKKSSGPTEEEVGEMGKKELKALNEELDLEVDMDGSTSSVRRAIIKAMKAGDHFDSGEKSSKGKGKSLKDEEAEDRNEKPARGRGKAKDEDDDKKAPAGKGKGKSKKYSAEDINGMDADELGELIEKHELDVDLDDHSTTKRKRSAVIDALESADLIAD